MRKQDEKWIFTAEMSWLRKIAGVTRLQKIRNNDMENALGSQATLRLGSKLLAAISQSNGRR